MVFSNDVPLVMRPWIAALRGWDFRSPGRGPYSEHNGPVFHRAEQGETTEHVMTGANLGPSRTRGKACGLGVGATRRCDSRRGEVAVARAPRPDPRAGDRSRGRPARPSSGQSARPYRRAHRREHSPHHRRGPRSSSPRARSKSRSETAALPVPQPGAPTRPYNRPPSSSSRGGPAGTTPSGRNAGSGDTAGPLRIAPCMRRAAKVRNCTPRPGS